LGNVGIDCSPEEGQHMSKHVRRDKF